MSNHRFFIISYLIFSLFVSSIIILPKTVGATEIWNQTYGGPFVEAAYSLVQTNDGGYAIAGGTDSFGAGDADFWLVKTDGSGNLEWNQTYGGSSFEFAVSMVQTSDNGYALTGETDSFGAGDADFWLVKTDGSGNLEWNQTYGGTEDDYAYSLVQTGDGGYAIAGVTYSFGAGDADFWLVKTDGSGNLEWNQTYGGTEDDAASSLVQTGDGGYAIAGATYWIGVFDFWLVKTDGSGNLEWNQTYGELGDDAASSLVQTGDGGYAIAGVTYSFGAGDADSLLVKTDGSGNLEWSQTYGGTEDDYAYSLVQTGDGGYAIAGGTDSFGAGDADSLLVKTDGSGNLEWIQTYGGTEDEVAYSLVQTGDGGYAIAGGIEYFNGVNSDFWWAKTDEHGVIPEFPSWIILPLFSVATFSVILIKKKLFPSRP
jgi:hypothetical protein